ncbi:hypothetical protein BD626DRAFT_506166 [Schizophyllum amplum]|uniref:Uncharacterized protein n=1 Tax=Schizophyllum amplum TaxID=97359 RepID=A0A550C5D2_9AGAR|nr:hypothetical protein BD626DRAFT_506166 [Auriculariopsis ampla]
MIVHGGRIPSSRFFALPQRSIMGDPQPVDLGLPEKLAPYESTLAIHYAKTEVVSFEFNPRNLESPAYALHALASFDLLHECATIRPCPQYTMSYPRGDACATRLCEPAGCVQAAQDQEDRAHKQPPQTEPARATRSAGVKKESGRVKQDTTPRLRTRPGAYVLAPISLSS